MSGTTSIDSLPSDPGKFWCSSTKCTNGNIKKKMYTLILIPNKRWKY